MKCALQEFGMDSDLVGGRGIAGPPLARAVSEGGYLISCARALAYLSVFGYACACPSAYIHI